jgi:hypothetical protein
MSCPHYILITNIKNLAKSKNVRGKFCPECNGFFEIKHVHTPVPTSEIPKKLKDKSGLLFIKTLSTENNLLWSITAALFPVTDTHGNSRRDTAAYKPFYDQLNFPDISDLNIWDAIDLIGESCEININIFIYEDNNFLPRRVPCSQYERMVDLIMLSDKCTFLIVKNLSSLYYERTQHVHYVCRRCLEICMSQEKLDEHQLHCTNHSIQRVDVGGERWMKFNNVRKQYPMLFTVYADFEAMFNGTEHIPICVSWKLVSTLEGETTEIQVYSGIDCVMVFLNNLIALYEEIKHHFEMHKPLELNELEELEYSLSTHCHICGNEFEGTVVKVRDHDHQTGNQISQSSKNNHKS